MGNHHRRRHACIHPSVRLCAIKRGLKLVLPYIRKVAAEREANNPIRVITYTYAFNPEEIKPVETAWCVDPHDENRKFKIFYYEFGASAEERAKEEERERERERKG